MIVYCTIVCTFITLLLTSTIMNSYNQYVPWWYDASCLYNHQCHQCPVNASIYDIYRWNTPSTIINNHHGPFASMIHGWRPKTRFRASDFAQAAALYSLALEKVGCFFAESYWKCHGWMVGECRELANWVGIYDSPKQRGFQAESGWEKVGFVAKTWGTLPESGSLDGFFSPKKVVVSGKDEVKQATWDLIAQTMPTKSRAESPYLLTILWFKEFMSILQLSCEQDRPHLYVRFEPYRYELKCTSKHCTFCDDLGLKLQCPTNCSRTASAIIPKMGLKLGYRWSSIVDI